MDFRIEHMPVMGKNLLGIFNTKANATEHNEDEREMLHHLLV